MTNFEKHSIVFCVAIALIALIYYNVNILLYLYIKKKIWKQFTM